MLTFQGVTPEVFALVLDQLRAEAHVQEIPGQIGDLAARTTPLRGLPYWIIQGSGLKSKVSYANSTAMVEIESKPFFVSEGMIESKIRDAITLAQQAVARAGGGV